MGDSPNANGDYAETVLENRRLNQDNTELRAKLKEKKADILVLERQGIVDRTKIEHLISKIENLTEEYDRERAPEMLRTIERLNAANTQLEDRNAELERDLERCRGNKPFKDIMETKPWG